MSKCILLVRVSTEQQSLDEQSNELKQMALADGFKEENIISIEEKESGIRLKEEERRGLNRLKEEISKGGVTCVYAWEISRIARTEKVLFSIKDFLVENSIQLKVKEPALTLLTPTEEVDSGAELVFSLYATLATQEMRNKVARFKRGKKEAKAKGKYIGGVIDYGFNVENGYFVINEDEMKNVRLIYKLYADGASLFFIQKYLKSNNIKTKKGVSFISSQISRLMRKEKYKDYIPEWEEVQDRLKSNTDAPRQKYSFRPAQKLVVCPECGQHFIRVKKNLTSNPYFYQCNGRREYRTNNPCKCSICIKGPTLDDIVWSVAMYREIKVRLYDTEEMFGSVEKTISKVEKEIEIVQKSLYNVSGTVERAQELYIFGSISKERYDLLCGKQEKEKESLEMQLSELDSRLAALKDQRKELNSFLNNRISISTLEQQLSEMTDEEKYTLVHKRILKIDICRDDKEHPETGKVYQALRLDFTFQDNTKESYWCYTKVGTGRKSKKAKRKTLALYSTVRNGVLVPYYTF